MALRVSIPRAHGAGLLRDARIGAGLTQAEVAGRLGVPQSFVSKYETGERRLDVGEVQAIGRVLGLSLVEFAVALGEREGRGGRAVLLEAQDVRLLALEGGSWKHKRRFNRPCVNDCAFTHVEAAMKRLLLIGVVVAASVCSPAQARARFEPYEARNSVVDGQGGSRITKEGIDFWTSGDPPRRYEIIGVIRDNRGTGILHGSAIGSSGIAKLVIERGGDAVILIDQNTALRSVWSQGQATLQGDYAYGSSISIPIQERTTTFAVVRYLGEEVPREPRGKAAPSAAPPAPAQSVEESLTAIATAAKTPAPIGFGFTVTRVEAVGQQLLLTASSTETLVITDEIRRGLQNDTCAASGLLPLLRAGASVRALMFGPGGEQLGAVMVTAHECGL